MLELYASLFVVGLMLADILSGFLGALRVGAVSSTVMREGLIKKTGSLLVIALAFAVEHMGTVVGIPAEFCSTAFGAIVTLITSMEIVSILENTCEINPDLPLSALFKVFDVERAARGDDEDMRG